uniref:AAA+ ATPase domain-containing protein n=1 Tax=Sexangularia sp. CB-2014 TaxID=1486929 RepID=A0A7S1V9L2_9EUKA
MLFPFVVCNQIVVLSECDCRTQCDAVSCTVNGSRSIVHCVEQSQTEREIRKHWISMGPRTRRTRIAVVLRSLVRTTLLSVAAAAQRSLSQVVTVADRCACGARPTIDPPPPMVVTDSTSTDSVAKLTADLDRLTFHRVDGGGPLRHAPEPGLTEQCEALLSRVLQPLVQYREYAKLGVRPMRGAMLTGPSGCGKSHLVRWLTASPVNVITIAAPELVAPELGASERALAQLFARARASAPTLLIIDELDTIGRTRGRDQSSEQSGERLLGALLQELDGMASLQAGDAPPITVLGVCATTSSLDSALVRPGRLAYQVRVTYPNLESVTQVLQTRLSRWPDTLSVIPAAAKALVDHRATMADVVSLVHSAAMDAMRAHQTVVTEPMVHAALHRMYNGKKY